jgi:L-ribulose-5-phosphate 4-epimerase
MKEIKQRVLEANKRLKKEELVISTWGNASEYDEKTGFVAIKASGIYYDKMGIDDIVIVDLDGNIVEGKLRPSTDCSTHLVIYKRFKGIKSVVHTHSMYATIWAQSGKNLPILGTTHADYFKGSIPCTRKMTKDEIETNYEKNTGDVIVEAFSNNINPLEIRAVLVYGHAPFVWGEDAHSAVTNAVVLEYIAKMAWCNTLMATEELSLLDENIINKHYNRKFGVKAYYGQY